MPEDPNKPRGPSSQPTPAPLRQAPEPERNQGISYHRRNYILDKLANLNQTAEGSILPPPQFGEFRVPFAYGFKIEKTTASQFGGTEFILSWSVVEEMAREIDHFEIYVLGLLANNQPVGPFRSKISPAKVRLDASSVTRVTFLLQTILKSGLHSDLPSAPTCVGVTLGLSTSTTYPAGTIPVSALAAGTAGKLITWDASGLPTTIGPGTSGQVLKSQGAGAVNTYVSLAGDLSGAPDSNTLATLLSAGGPTGGATTVPIITWDAKGRLTAVSSTTITGTVPGGSAGGALSGTYPSPGLANLGTAGAVAFVHGTNTDRLAIDDANFHWDDSTNRLGIGTNAPSYPLDVRGDISVGTLGSGFRVAEGSNAKMGASVLVAGTVTVSTTAVTANSRIFLTHQNNSGTPGFVTVSARSAGTSFTITSSNGADTSTIGWILFEPA